MAIGDNTVAMAIGESSKAAQAREGKNFPAGMRVVAIDDDQICLAMLNKLLIKCEYQVTCFTNAVEALKMIKEKKDEIDLVITDVHMPNFDGFQLLEIAGLQLDLPVIMLSSNDTKETVMKGVMHGACDYIIKPARFEELSVIWKHVARRQSNLEFNEDTVNNNHTEIQEDNDARRQRGSHGGNGASNDAENTTGKRRMEDSDDMESDDKAAKKKPRLVWSHDLHRTFVNAISDIGVDKAVPKSILEKMSMDDLTRENVASHLQKYRMYLKRVNSSPNAFQAGFSPGSSFNIDLRSFELFKHFHSHGRYRKPSRSNTSAARSTRLNNTSANSPISSAVPNPVSSSQMTQIDGGTGLNNTGPSNLTSTNNAMNNDQMNLYRGVNGVSSFPGTSNSLPQFNSNPNYASMYYPAWAPVPFAPFGYPMTNVPPISTPNSMVGPLFGVGSSLIGGSSNFGTGVGSQQPGGNFNSEIGVRLQQPGGNSSFGTEAGLQQFISSFNTSWSVPNLSIGNPNNINCDNFSPFFNNPTDAHSAMSGGIGTGTANDGIETGTVSGGMGFNPVSGGMESDPLSGAMGSGPVSGGMGTGILSSGVGTSLVSGIRTGNVSGVIETGNVTDGFGTGIVGGGMGTSNVSGGMETGIVRGGMEIGPVSGGMGTDIVSGMETRPVNQGDSVFGGASFGRADSVADDASSSSYHDIDDVSISGLDELLSSLRTNDGGDGADSQAFMDDFFN